MKLTLIGVNPRFSTTYPPKRERSVLVASEMWIRKGWPELSIRDAVLTVSPKRQ